MTHRSKIAIFSILGQTAVFVPLYNEASRATTAGIPLEGQISLWAAFFLKLLGLSVAVTVVGTILLQMILQLRGKESVFTVTDERDRLIEAKAVRNFCYVFCFGFFLGMLLIVLGQSAALLFHAFAFSYLAAGIVLYLSYIFHYERGY